MTGSHKKPRPIKDVNSADRTYFLRVVVMFMFYGLVTLPAFLVFFGWKGLFVWFLIVLSLAIGVEFITNALGTTAGRLYTGRKAHWNVREKLQGELSAARVQKMKGQHERALEMIEAILSRDPGYAEALLVKAQILDEVYHESREALSCLDRAISLSKEGDSVRRWARTLKHDITTR